MSMLIKIKLNNCSLFVDEIRYKHDMPSSKIGPDISLYLKNLILGVCRTPKLCPLKIFMESLQKSGSPTVLINNKRLSKIIKKKPVLSFRIFAP
jgi:hypothetical protein